MQHVIPELAPPQLIFSQTAQILDNIHDAFFLCNLSVSDIDSCPGSILFVNKAAPALTEYSRDELLSMNFNDLLRSDSDNSLPFDICKISNYSHIPNILLYSKDKKSIKTDLLISFYDSEKSIFSIAVKEYPQNSTQAITKNDPLILANKMTVLGALISGLAHDINNPNNLIILSADVLKDIWDEIRSVIDNKFITDKTFTVRGYDRDSIDKNITTLFENFISGSEKINSKVAAIKEFVLNDQSDIESNFDIKNVINSAVEIANNLIKKSTDHFEITIQPGIPFLRGCQRQLELAIVNLLLNACQSLTNKTQKIAVTASFSEEKNTVSIKVMDEGEGISKENLNKIFERYYTTRNQKEHMGLGLSIVESIVKNHNGCMEVDSQSGRGSNFIIDLPLSQFNDFSNKTDFVRKEF